MSDHVPSASKEQVRRTRSEYRLLTRTLDDRKNEILCPGNKVLAESVTAANNLYANVSRPQEATLDSRVLLSAAGLAQSKAKNIKKGKEVFNVDEFVAKIAAFLGEDNHNKAELGKICTRYIRRPPLCDFMLGPLQLEKKERTQKAREARRKSRAEVVRPDALTDESTTNTSNSTTKTTILVAKLLAKHSPIDLFSFIINPRSFSQSIENMFSLAFLVKESRAGIYENEEGMQIVRYIDPDNPTQSIPQHLRSQNDNGDLEMINDGWEERQQGVMTLDMATWEEAIDVLDLRTSIIPHRQETERIRQTRL